MLLLPQYAVFDFSPTYKQVTLILCRSLQCTFHNVSAHMHEEFWSILDSWNHNYLYTKVHVNKFLMQTLRTLYEMTPIFTCHRSF